MYALRLYQANEDLSRHTNTKYGIFTMHSPEKHSYKYIKNEETIAWSRANFGIWTNNDRKETLYPLPIGCSLYLFSKLPLCGNVDETNLIASTTELDDYIMFKPLCHVLQNDCVKEEEFIIIIAPSLAKAKELLL